MTPSGRKQFDQSQRGHESNNVYRWKEWNSHGKLASVLFDLTAKDNELARRIRKHAYARNQDGIDKIVNNEIPVFDQVNDLLRLAGFLVTIENSEGEEILSHHRDSTSSFSIAKMSDGERNAVILAANVLTVRDSTVLLIDEPERHLHRSIVEPFLSALFDLRPKCSFVVATHELALPMSNPDARVLVLRSCSWNGESPHSWDVYLLEPNEELPEELKRTILGTRQVLLFVEGDSQSLDTPLYTALFPDLSVVSVGDCNEVIKSVRGLRNSYSFHNVSAFGLIDGDSRSDQDVGRLEADGIYLVEGYSVEFLYYCSESMAVIAQWQAKALGRNAEEMLKTAKRVSLKLLGDGDIAGRMAARRSEGNIRTRIMSKIPGWRQIQNGAEKQVQISTESDYQEELERYSRLIDEHDLDRIVARYPVRETGVLGLIAKAFELKTSAYERTLISRLRDNGDLAANLKRRIRPLADAIEEARSENASHGHGGSGSPGS